MGKLIAAAALALWGVAGPASGADALAGIHARLAAHPVVRAEFTQTRRIAALKRPVVTRGRVLVSREDGIIWQVEAPYAATFVLGRDTLIEIGADGARTVRAARQSPVAAHVLHIMRALAAGDTGTLGSWFEVDASMENGHWTASLVPREGQLAQRLSAVRASGGAFVETVRIVEAGGDATELEFRNHRGAAAASEDERRLFGGN